MTDRYVFPPEIRSRMSEDDQSDLDRLATSARKQFLLTEPMPVHGADISHWQSGTLDLPGAKSRGLDWLMHKATDGLSFQDNMYWSRRSEANHAALPFGGYHFAQARLGEAAVQARGFLQYAMPTPGDLRPALDIETNPAGLSLAELRTWTKNYVTAIEDAIGVKPWVYTPYDLTWALDGCIVWRPRYNDSNTPPTLPYDIWQFSNGVFGVPNFLEGIGHVDLNTMRPGLTMADLVIPQEEDVPLTDADAALVAKALLAAQIKYDPDAPDGSATGNLARHFESVRTLEKANATLAKQVAADVVDVLEDTTTLLNRGVTVTVDQATLQAALVGAIRELLTPAA